MTNSIFELQPLGVEEGRDWATHIAQNLRIADLLEVAAGCNERSLEGFLLRQWEEAEEGFFLLHQGEPAALLMARETHPGCWLVALLATENWPKVAAFASRHIKKTFIPRLKAKGLRRAYCLSDAQHREAHIWLVWLGFQPEGRLRRYGANGEDFFVFAWLPCEEESARQAA